MGEGGGKDAQSNFWGCFSERVLLSYTSELADDADLLTAL